MGVVYWSPVCTLIGLINLAVHLLAVYNGFDTKPYHFYSSNPLWYQYLSSIFIHLDWQHLTGNAFFLFAFGCQLEKKINPLFFILLFLLSGVGGNAAFQYFNPTGQVIGASGAIFGIICATAFLDYKALVVAPGAPLPVPIFIFCCFYLYNEFAMAQGDPSTQVAHIAHIGGGVAGAVVALGSRRFFGKSTKGKAA